MGLHWEAGANQAKVGEAELLDARSNLLQWWVFWKELELGESSWRRRNGVEGRAGRVWRAFVHYEPPEKHHTYGKIELTGESALGDDLQIRQGFLRQFRNPTLLIRF
jgi:hypothetical protein